MFRPDFWEATERVTFVRRRLERFVCPQHSNINFIFINIVFLQKSPKQATTVKFAIAARPDIA